MSAPFRELFVELPAAVLEVLRGAVEHDIRRRLSIAADRAHRPSIVSLLSTGKPAVWLADALCSTFGWRTARVGRASDTPDLEILFVRPCGCCGCVLVDELALSCSADKREAVEAVFRAADRDGRCYCVAGPP